MELTPVQKALRWVLAKATGAPQVKAFGFPPWNTTNWPSGWVSNWEIGSTEPLQLAAVYGCVRVYTNTIGKLPFYVYTAGPGGTQVKDINHPLYRILHASPNVIMNSMSFRQAMVQDYALTGNGYAEVVKSGKRVVAINPLMASHMWVGFQPPDYSRVIYRYTHRNGKLQDYSPAEILHIKNFSIDGGITGISPIRRYMIEHGLALQSYGKNFVLNGARPAGALKFKGKRPTSEDTVKKYKSDWKGEHGGPENAGSTAILWEDASYEVIGVPPDEAQFLETTQLNAAQIAGGIYGVPLRKLGIADKADTYASAEQYGLDFWGDTVQPIVSQIVQEFNKKLFDSDVESCGFDLDDLLKTDRKSLSEYYGNLVNHGLMALNEARQRLNLPPVEGGDEVIVQGAMVRFKDLQAPKPVVAQPGTVGGTQ